jgi:hypothetical protein
MRCCFTLGILSRQAEFERGTHRLQMRCESPQKKGPPLWGRPVQSLSTPVKKIRLEQSQPREMKTTKDTSAAPG